MRLAKVVREVVAEELQGELPASGKQFLQTPRGHVASRTSNHFYKEGNYLGKALSINLTGAGLEPQRLQARPRC